ncbi:MAG: hypothetical protein H6745_02865 [Deltaproteobacteria bacterium]|nr:hypothetical protein [Deltaproteobacteria bacterium]
MSAVGARVVVRAAGLAAAAGLALAPAGAARAVDYPPVMPLPSWDLAVGLTGGVAFGEARSGGEPGFLAGVDVGLLEGVLGLHVGLRTHREGYAQRLGGLVEATVWYVVMLGVGVRFGHMLDDGGPGVPEDEIGLTVLVAAPFPVWRLDDGAAGALVVAPFFRPGLRFLADGAWEGYHEAGVMLRWTSFGF